MFNNLLALSGAPVPYLGAALQIHQPTIREISMIGGETPFFSGVQVLNFDKNNLPEQGKKELENYSNFNIIMSIMRDKSPDALDTRINVYNVLTLLFPNYDITFEQKEIKLEKDKEIHCINDSNFQQFQKILFDIFNLDGKQHKDFQPTDDLARKIAEKIKKGKQKTSSLKANKEINIFGRYVSILAVGQSKDMNKLFDYTMLQLIDQFKRFNLKQNYDLYIQQKLAGAKDVKQVDNWTKDLYNDESNQSHNKI